MDTPYEAPFMRGWVNTADTLPTRDGSYVMFARGEERTQQDISYGQCPFVFGFWNANHDTPCWCDSYGMKIVPEHWPRWKALRELAWSPLNHTTK